MAFPSNPTNGQTATINNISYTYSTTTSTWNKTGAVSTASPVSSVAGRTGSVTLTAADIGAGTFPSALVAGSTFQTTSLGIGTAASGTTGEIRATNAITAYYSDQRLKTVVGTIDNALDRVDMLTAYLYTQNQLAEQFGYNNYEVRVGHFAQDVQRALPQAVKPAPFDAGPNGSSLSGENYLTVQYELLVPLLAEAIKELRVEVNGIKDFINSSKGE
jgi:hypothetical protein